MSDDFLGADFFEQTDERRFMEVPLSRGKVRIRSLTEAELTEWRLSCLNASGDTTKDRLASSQRRMIVRSVVNAAGDLILNEHHVDTMSRKDGKDISTLAAACQRFNGVDDREVEDLVGNSAAIGATE